MGNILLCEINVLSVIAITISGLTLVIYIIDFFTKIRSNIIITGHNYVEEDNRIISIKITNRGYFTANNISLSLPPIKSNEAAITLIKDKTFNTDDNLVKNIEHFLDSSEKQSSEKQLLTIPYNDEKLITLYCGNKEKDFSHLTFVIKYNTNYFRCKQTRKVSFFYSLPPKISK